MVITKRYWQRGGIREHRPIFIERAGWLADMFLEEMLTRVGLLRDIGIVPKTTDDPMSIRRR